MASNPLFIIPDSFFCIFLMNFAMATLGLKEMGKFLQTLGSHSQINWENVKKGWYYKKWVGRHASFSPRRSVKFQK